MKSLSNAVPKLKALRRKALRKLHNQKEPPKSAMALDLEAALEELRIHSAELEIQNEELQRSRLELEKSQQLYFRHFDLAPVGMIRLDQKGFVLEANILGALMLGIDRARIRSNKTNFAARVALGSLSTFQNHLKGALASVGMESCEITLRNATRGESFVQLQSVCSAGGNEPGELLVTLTDLTTQRRAEASRLDLEHTLLARQKLDNIGTLAGGIAHDLNNILQIIIANLDLLAVRSVTDDAELPFLQDARRAAKRATGLSRRLLTFSKGKSFVKQTLDVREILASSVFLAVSGSSLQPFLSIQPQLHPITVDPVQFAQVIENIVINAREATLGGGKIFVRAANVGLDASHRSGLPSGGYIKIEIEDRGIGIPEHIRSRVFDAFFTTKSGGHGIGLATAASIVKQHQGSIEMESIVGHGTTVTLLLPAADSSAVFVPARQPDIIVKGSGRILVIDDEELILRVTSSMLTKLGYESTVAKDGEVGCELYVQSRVEGKPFAAVLLDGTIPDGLGGEAALKRFLAVDPDACVILSSGYVDHDLFGQVEQLGFKQSLAKPFGVLELADVLNKVLS
jgi:two-component system, cell cycle sensor histidine kinase and response regulator CckA